MRKKRKYTVDDFILLMVFLGSILFVIIVIGRSISDRLLFFALAMGLVYLYFPISGLIRHKMKNRFGSYVTFKENPVNFIIAVVVYVFFGLIIIYQAIRLLLW